MRLAAGGSRDPAPDASVTMRLRRRKGLKIAPRTTGFGIQIQDVTVGIRCTLPKSMPNGPRDSMIKIWRTTSFTHSGPGRSRCTRYPARRSRPTIPTSPASLCLEAIGFEGVFFTEHHFLSALSPNPNLLIAALARMRSGFASAAMGNVLPYHQPWRLAEDLAMLDYITEGRLEIGMASGVAPEFVFLKIPPDDIRPDVRRGTGIYRQGVRATAS